jgi:hypothetical protein
MNNDSERAAYGNRQTVPNLRYYLIILSGGAEENRVKPRSGQPISEPEHEAGTCEARNRSASNSTETFGDSLSPRRDSNRGPPELK